jgi:hypothetical protein
MVHRHPEGRGGWLRAGPLNDAHSSALHARPAAIVSVKPISAVPSRLTLAIAIATATSSVGKRGVKCANASSGVRRDADGDGDCPHGRVLDALRDRQQGMIRRVLRLDSTRPERSGTRSAGPSTCGDAQNFSGTYLYG